MDSVYDTLGCEVHLPGTLIVLLLIRLANGRLTGLIANIFTTTSVPPYLVSCLTPLAGRSGHIVGICAVTSAATDWGLLETILFEGRRPFWHTGAERRVEKTGVNGDGGVKRQGVRDRGRRGELRAGYIKQGIVSNGRPGGNILGFGQCGNGAYSVREQSIRRRAPGSGARTPGCMDSSVRTDTTRRAWGNG